MDRNKKTSGAAMVIVLCVMVVFLALSATILLAGSVALNTARNNVTYERGKVQAASLSEVFARDMVEKGMTVEDTSGTTPGLARYVRDQIINNGWIPYDEGTDNYKDAVKTFTMDEGDSKHQITIEMYWTYKPDDGKVISLPDIKDIEGQLVDYNVYLTVDVISTLNDSEYHVKRDFQLQHVDGNTSATSSSYPYLWKWEAVGRSSDR